MFSCKFAACIFSEHLFQETPLGGCFWIGKGTEKRLILFSTWSITLWLLNFQGIQSKYFFVICQKCNRDVQPFLYLWFYTAWNWSLCHRYTSTIAEYAQHQQADHLLPKALFIDISKTKSYSIVLLLWPALALTSMSWGTVFKLRF